MSAIIVCPKCQHTMQETKENCVVCRKCLFRCHVEYVNGWDAALKQGAQKPSTNNASAAIVSELCEAFEEWDLLPDPVPTERLLDALHTIGDYCRETKAHVA